jgi:hypothetical protein
MKPVRKIVGGVDPASRRLSTSSAPEPLSLSTRTSSRPVRKFSNPVSPPTTIELRGVPIHFPFKPYKCQEDYMSVVLDALLRGENALLESPTGTMFSRRRCHCLLKIAADTRQKYLTQCVLVVE